MNSTIKQFIIDAYNAGKVTSFKRHSRMIYAKKQFIKKYGQEGLEKYFNGSNKQLWFFIEDCIN